MSERRKSTRLRTFLEIAGGVVAVAAVFVAIIQYDYTKRKDAEAIAMANSDKEHGVILAAVAIDKAHSGRAA